MSYCTYLDLILISHGPIRLDFVISWTNSKRTLSQLKHFQGMIMNCMSRYRHTYQGIFLHSFPFLWYSTLKVLYLTVPSLSNIRNNLAALLYSLRRSFKTDSLMAVPFFRVPLKIFTYVHTVHQQCQPRTYMISGHTTFQGVLHDVIKTSLMVMNKVTNHQVYWGCVKQYISTGPSYRY